MGAPHKLPSEDILIEAYNKLGLTFAKRGEYAAELRTRATIFDTTPSHHSVDEYAVVFQNIFNRLVLDLNGIVERLPALARQPSIVLKQMMELHIIKGKTQRCMLGDRLFSRDEMQRAQQGAKIVATLDITKLSRSAIKTIFNSENQPANRTIALGMIYELTDGFTTVNTAHSHIALSSVSGKFSEAQHALLKQVEAGLAAQDPDFQKIIEAAVAMRHRRAGLE